ncbi:uncharacterized protein LOC127094690 [Lathyrus oleraceus]|uniref:uncharacterized protein LOC127094690 n=1 Tax=Pisum sativum TaxID=3888 RepID=UPI0021CFF3C2|nr:uncharacterized protein LOC127094690 [Pisum sativum]
MSCAVEFVFHLNLGLKGNVEDDGKFPRRRMVFERRFRHRKLGARFHGRSVSRGIRFPFDIVVSVTWILNPILEPSWSSWSPLGVLGRKPKSFMAQVRFRAHTTIFRPAPPYRPRKPNSVVRRRGVDGRIPVRTLDRGASSSAAAAEPTGYPGGPYDTSLLVKYEHHVARHIWFGEIQP